MAFKVSDELTATAVLKLVSEYDIFMTYCSPFKEVDKMFKSELRVDNNPTCKISINKTTGDLLYGDFNGPKYNCFQYLQAKYNVDYNTALNIINRDFKLGLYPSWSSIKTSNITLDVKPVITNKNFKKKAVVVKKRKRHWVGADSDYWFKKYGITRKTLVFFNVEPIDFYWVNDNRFTCKTITYSYEFGNGARDIYSPLKTDGFKWGASTTKIHNIYGYKQLPATGDILFIVSSLKEVMLLYEMGITAVAPQSESTFIPKEILSDLQSRFTNLTILFDFDKAGRDQAKKFGEMYNIDYLKFTEDTISEFDGKKDLSDAYEVDKDKVINLLINYEVYE